MGKITKVNTFDYIKILINFNIFIGMNGKCLSLHFYYNLGYML